MADNPPRSEPPGKHGNDKNPARELLIILLVFGGVMLAIYGVTSAFKNRSPIESVKRPTPPPPPTAAIAPTAGTTAALSPAPTNSLSKARSEERV